MKLLPLFRRWSEEPPDDAAAQIDRSLEDRQHRLSTGIWVPPTFDRVEATLLVTRGRGKFIRFEHAVGTTVSLPNSLRREALELTKSDNASANQLRSVQRDLAEFQTMAIDQVKTEAGKYVDRILTIGVQDPGRWSKDFDGRIEYQSLCDAVALAEKTGISVVDDFPARDLTVGGTGTPLEPLPLWLLFSDRNSRVASVDRHLIQVGNQIAHFDLPASDGLDAQIPKLAIGTFPGAELLRSIAEGRLTDIDARPASPTIDLDHQIVRLLAAGNPVPDVQLASFDNPPAELAPGLVRFVQAKRNPSLASEEALIADTLATAASWIMHQLQHTIEQRSQTACSDSGKCHQWLLEYESDPVSIALSDWLQDHLPGPAQTIHERAASEVASGALVAAVLGLCHIDQLPANVPRLTGADSQRILGRLTPGRPSNWRQLVRMMAQYRPAPMKLKDAI